MLSARCRAWTSSRWATNGAGVHHNIEFSGVLDRRLDRSVARMGITPTTGCPGHEHRTTRHGVLKLL